MLLDSGSDKDFSAYIRESTWRFGARGLNGECCGDLSQPEYRALCLASDKRQCSMQEIAQGLGFTKSGATRVIDRLEKKGYVERRRSSEDGRVCCVKVSPSGRALIKDLSQENENHIARIMSKIDPAMQEVIRTAFGSFVQAIKEED